MALLRELASGREYPLSATALVSGCARYLPKPLWSQLASPDQDSVTIAIQNLDHPIVKPIPIDLAKGLSPEQASVLSLIVNPSLRAERDRRAQSAAQLLQAGILPNPTLAAGLPGCYIILRPWIEGHF